MYKSKNLIYIFYWVILL